jgi:hypothetical protein
MMLHASCRWRRSRSSPQDMAGGANRVRRYEAAAQHLTAEDAAFVRTATEAVVLYIRSNNQLALQFVSAYALPVEAGDRTVVTVELRAGAPAGRCCSKPRA